MIYPNPWREEVKGKINIKIEKLFCQNKFKKGAIFLQKELDLLFSEEKDSDLLIVDFNHPEVIKRGENGLDKLGNNESYFLDTTKRPFLIAASSARGSFWGIQSLLQLYKDDIWTKAKVWDEPAFSMRGMHTYLPARKNIPFFKKWIQLLSRLKYNILFLEVGGAMEYKKHPEINEAWLELNKSIVDAGGEVKHKEKSLHPKDSRHSDAAGGSYLIQEEVKELVEYARSFNIEVIPEVPSLSHSYYLCCAHPEIAERQEDPYPDTYCPFHPYTYKLLFDVMDEVIEVFQPKMIEMGHDEWYHIGICPLCKDTDPSYILAHDIKKIHEYLSARKIKMAMWGDKLLNIVVAGNDYGGRKIIEQNINGDTYKAIDMIPRDILMLDWYWVLDHYTEEYFTQHGFDQLFANFNPLAFTHSEKRLSSSNIKGGQFSAWCAVQEDAFAYTGIIQNALFSANTFWWKNYSDRAKEQTFQKVKKIIPEVRKLMGEALLEKESERTIKLEQVKTGEKKIKIKEKINGINFIHFALEHFEFKFIFTWRLLKDAHFKEHCIGNYIIKTKSKTYKIPVIYGVNISHNRIHPLVNPFRGPGGTGNNLLYYADIYKEGTDEWGNQNTIYSLPWINPDPEDEVLEIVIEGKQELLEVQIMS